MSNETKNAAAGWYPHPNMQNTQRYWDGSAWTDHIARAEPRGRVSTRPESPAGVSFAGFLVSCVGGVLFAASAGAAPVVTFAGAVLIAVGGALTMVGVIAAGVRLGVRHVDHERQQRAG